MSATAARPSCSDPPGRRTRCPPERPGALARSTCSPVRARAFAVLCDVGRPKCFAPDGLGGAIGCELPASASARRCSRAARADPPGGSPASFKPASASGKPSGWMRLCSPTPMAGGSICRTSPGTCGTTPGATSSRPAVRCGRCGGMICGTRRSPRGSTPACRSRPLKVWSGHRTASTLLDTYLGVMRHDEALGRARIEQAFGSTD